MHTFFKRASTTTVLIASGAACLAFVLAGSVPTTQAAAQFGQCQGPSVAPQGTENLTPVPATSPGAGTSVTGQTGASVSAGNGTASPAGNAGASIGASGTRSSNGSQGTSLISVTAPVNAGTPGATGASGSSTPGSLISVNVPVQTS